MSDTLNMACFEHDVCYTQNCVLDMCIFSPQSASCDAWLYSVCGEVTTNADKLVCRRRRYSYGATERGCVPKPELLTIGPEL